MNIVILVLFLMFFLYWSFKKSSHNYKAIALFIFSISFLIACRSISVPDTKGYLEYYNSLTGFESFLFYTFELGFQYYTYILKSFLGDHDRLYLFCITLINSIFIFDALRRIQRLSNDNENQNINLLLLGLVLLFSYYGLFYNAITIRAGIAMIFYLQAFSYVCKDNLTTSDIVKIFVISFVSFFFHKSSVIFWLILFVARFMPRCSKRTYLLVVFFSCLIFFSRLNLFLLNVFTSTIEKIIDLISSTSLNSIAFYREVMDEAETGLSFKFMFQLFSGFLFLTLRFESMPRIYFRFLNIYYIGLLLGAFLAPITMMYRVLDYFLILTFILYVFWAQSSKYSLRTIFLISSCVVIYQLILFYRVIIS